MNLFFIRIKDVFYLIICIRFNIVAYFHQVTALHLTFTNSFKLLINNRFVVFAKTTQFFLVVDVTNF